MAPLHFECGKQFNATTFTDRLPHQVMICLDCQNKKHDKVPVSTWGKYWNLKK